MHAANRLGPRAIGWIAGATDVFHASNQVHYAPPRARLTATIHDLTTFFMPELHTRGNIKADENFVGRILRRADALIAVSENTRQDAIRFLKISPERITTIHSGVPDEYFVALPTSRKRPYVLYVGTIEPRKNLGALLDAWSQLKPDLLREFDLVFAGPAGWAARSMLDRIQAEATHLGYVPERELPGLISGATAFVYPSLYEGFGFPVVQAMAAGTPTITSNTSCLPEITEDAALLVDPRSPGEIAAAITRLLESETLQTSLAAKGKERAECYRWSRCAEESLQFFRKVAGNA
jgi:alpha-1,3-rhamnosyl/mannosyltransferase